MRQERQTLKEIIARTEIQRVTPPLPQWQEMILYVALWVSVGAIAVLLVGGCIYWSGKIAAWLA